MHLYKCVWPIGQGRQRLTEQGQGRQELTEQLNEVWSPGEDYGIKTAPLLLSPQSVAQPVRFVSLFCKLRHPSALAASALLVVDALFCIIQKKVDCSWYNFGQHHMSAPHEVCQI